MKVGQQLALHVIARSVYWPISQMQRRSGPYDSPAENELFSGRPHSSALAAARLIAVAWETARCGSAFRIAVILP